MQKSRLHQGARTLATRLAAKNGDYPVVKALLIKVPFAHFVAQSFPVTEVSDFLLTEGEFVIGLPLRTPNHHPRQ